MVLVLVEFYSGSGIVTLSLILSNAVDGFFFWLGLGELIFILFYFIFWGILTQVVLFWGGKLGVFVWSVSGFILCSMFFLFLGFMFVLPCFE